MTSIRPALAAADRALSLEVKKMQTVGHLRRTARDIAAELCNVHDESAEVVALQNAFENALNSYLQAMRTPAAALSYVAPDAVRARLTAQGVAARAELSREHNPERAEEERPDGVIPIPSPEA